MLKPWMLLAALLAALVRCGTNAATPPATSDDSPDAASAYGGDFATDDAALPPPTAVAPANDVSDDDGGMGMAMGMGTAMATVTAPAPSLDSSPPDDAAGAQVDAAPGPPFDAGPGGVCAGPPGPGDLLIDELMIESVAGSGDHGEWFEVESTRDCALDLRGLHGECPHGAGVISFDVTSDLWIPARGTFVVADSSDRVVDHALPTPVVAWSGQQGDVLRNGGNTLTLRQDDAVVDSLTYPSMTWVVGTSLAFPSACDAGTRQDWTQWHTSTASWFPGFFGTPNTPNDDVSCL